MGRYFTREDEAKPDGLTVAAYYCLGHKLPSHINPFAHLDVDQFECWDRYEQELLAMWDGEGMPDSWHAWKENKENA